METRAIGQEYRPIILIRRREHLDPPRSESTPPMTHAAQASVALLTAVCASTMKAYAVTWQPARVAQNCCRPSREPIGLNQARCKSLCTFTVRLASSSSGIHARHICPEVWSYGSNEDQRMHR